ncbi:MAG: hypothetical protein IJ723_04510 [Ruminococcus sp.]|nr:hypothetical protein [Ruminococcus sp.]
MSMEFGIKNDKITKALLRTTIAKALEDIQRDPQRSVRNLVDLGLNFAEGCNQREIFDITQRYLSNEDSAYYRLAENIVGEIDHRKLITYGINFGYNGCTSGARVLREKAAELGIHIPFLLIFTIDDSEDALTPEDIVSAVRQGMELGIYIYALICATDRYPELLEIAGQFSECAFIYFVNPRRLTRETISRVSELENIVTSVRCDGESDACLEAISAMRAQGCITVAHYEYSPASINAILSNAITDYFSETGAIAGILYAAEGTDLKAQEIVADYTMDIVRSQQYPFFMFEAKHDLTRFEKMFSNVACFVYIKSGGKAHYSSEQTEVEGVTLRSGTLVDVLRGLRY